MGGTQEGNRKIRDKLLAQDPEYFSKLGSKGGKAYHSKPQGFGSEKVDKNGLTGSERARLAGKNAHAKDKSRQS